MSTSYIERIEISNPQRLRSYTAMFLLPLGYMPSLVWCIQNLFHTNTVVGICYRYTGQIGTFIRYMCYYSIKTIFAYLLTPYFNPLSKKTSTESNEADEIYLLSRTKKLYIIFQHIDKPFYLKFWMQCMSYIKTISTL